MKTLHIDRIFSSWVCLIRCPAEQIKGKVRNSSINLKMTKFKSKYHGSLIVRTTQLMGKGKSYEELK